MQNLKTKGHIFIQSYLYIYVRRTFFVFFFFLVRCYFVVFFFFFFFYIIIIIIIIVWFGLVDICLVCSFVCLFFGLIIYLVG